MYDLLRSLVPPSAQSIISQLTERQTFARRKIFEAVYTNVNGVSNCFDMINKVIVHDQSDRFEDSVHWALGKEAPKDIICLALGPWL